MNYMNGNNLWRSISHASLIGTFLEIPGIEGQG